MSQLFVALYLDEDVDVLLADLIRARGFTVVTTREANNLQASDAAQLAYAAAQQSVLFTHNRVDFENLARTYFANGQHHAGIIIAVRRSPYDIAQRLLIILNNGTADEMHDQIRYI